MNQVRPQPGLMGQVRYHSGNLMNRWRNYWQSRVPKEDLAFAILNRKQTSALSMLHRGIDLTIRDFSVRPVDGGRPVAYSRWLEDVLIRTITDRLEDMQDGELDLYDTEDEVHGPVTVYNKYQLVLLLLRNGVNINSEAGAGHGTFYKGWTPLMFACKFDEFSIFELLIQRGANVNGLNKHGELKSRGGQTPLTEAVRIGNKDMVIEFEN